MLTKHSELNKWEKRFLALSKVISTWSKDPSTKCGAVITRGNRIISLGFNGFPMFVSDSNSRYKDRALKYKIIIHAEMNAILFAKEPLTNTTLYTYPCPPCCRCSAHIIQSGIRKVISPVPSNDLVQRWAEEFKVSSEIFMEAGVQSIQVIL